MGLTQVELAERLNVSQSTITSWENGNRRPDLDLLPVIAQIFGVSVDELLGREEEKKEPPKGEALDSALVDLLVNLTPDQVQRVKDFLAGMKASSSTV